MLGGDILQFAGRLAEEMMMVGRVGVEIRAPGLDHGLAQQAYLGKLVQRVINGSERYLYARSERFAVQILRGHVSIAAFEKKPGERQTLTGRPEAGGAQTP